MIALKRFALFCSLALMACGGAASKEKTTPDDESELTEDEDEPKNKRIASADEDDEVDAEEDAPKKKAASDDDDEEVDVDEEPAPKKKKKPADDDDEEVDNDDGGRVSEAKLSPKERERQARRDRDREKLRREMEREEGAKSGSPFRAKKAGGSSSSKAKKGKGKSTDDEDEIDEEDEEEDEVEEDPKKVAAAKKKAEAERKKEEAQAKRDEAARKKAEEAERKKAEAQAKRDEAARKKEEAAQKKAEELAKKKEAADAKKREAEEKKRAAAEAKKKPAVDDDDEEVDMDEDEDDEEVDMDEDVASTKADEKKKADAAKKAAEDKKKADEAKRAAEAKKKADEAKRVADAKKKKPAEDEDEEEEEVDEAEDVDMTASKPAPEPEEEEEEDSPPIDFDKLEAEDDPLAGKRVAAIPVPGVDGEPTDEGPEGDSAKESFIPLSTRPLTLGTKGAAEIHGGFRYAKITFPGMTPDMDITSSSQAFLLGGTYAINEKLEIGGDYVLSVNPGRLKGPLTFRGAYQVKAGKLDFAAAGALAIDFFEQENMVTNMTISATYASLQLGAWVRYHATPKVSFFTGQPALPTSGVGLAEAGVPLPPFQYQVGVSLNSGRPITLQVPAGVSYQVSKAIFAFSSLNLANIGIANSGTFIFGRDFIPFVLGGFYSLTKADVGATFSADLKQGADYLRLDFVLRYRLK